MYKKWLLILIPLIVGSCDDKCTDTNRQKAREFADQHWIESKYVEWYQTWENWYDFPDYALDPLENHLTHILPNTKNDDYYEVIGLYDQFVYGWDDVHGDPLNLKPGDSTLAPRESIIVFEEAWLDTVYFDPYIGDIQSAHRQEYLDMIMLD